MLVRSDLAIYQGDDWAAIVTVLAADNTPADVSNHVPQAQIRLGPADTNPVLVEIGAYVDPINPSLVHLSLPSATTTLMSGRYVWDLQLVASDGTIITMLYGNVTVQQEITREVVAS